MKEALHYIYTRCSTEEQLKKGFSHEYQISDIKMMITGTCLGIFSDTISGTTFERPELETLAEICKENPHHAKYIWVQKWDRFGRDITDSLNLIRKLTRYGIEVNCPTEYIDFQSDDWPIMLSLKLSIAQSESIRISTRTRKGIRAAHKLGYVTSTAPIGYTREAIADTTSAGKKRRILKPDHQAYIIKDIFHKFTNKVATRIELYHTYASKLNCSRSTFYAIFTNPIYAGKLKTSDGTILPAIHQPLISDLVYHQAQEMLTTYNNTKSQSLTKSTAHFPLKGILTDSQGKLMTTCFSKGRSKYYPYYQSTRQKGRDTVSATKAHKLVEYFISHLIPVFQFSKEEIISSIKRKQQPLYDQIQDLENKLDNSKNICNKLEEDYLENGILDALEYKRLRTKQLVKHSQLTKEINSIKSQLQLPKLDQNSLEKIYNLNRLYQVATPERKRILLKAIFPDKFTIENDQVKTTYLNSFLCIDDTLSDVYPHLTKEKRTKCALNVDLGGKHSYLKTIQDLILLAS